MRDRILEQIQQMPLLSELRTGLERLVAHDWPQPDTARNGDQVHAVVTTIYTTLSGGSAVTVQPFLRAWLTLYAALLHLDHLQDADPSVVPGDMPAAQYNLVFAYYVLAMTLLSDLDQAEIPVTRVVRLHQMWSAHMLCAAGGQQRDLAGSLSVEDASVLAHYEQAIQAKAGIVYGLALGGAATLATDHQPTIAALSTAGQVYGTLLQWSDDLRDAPHQRDQQLTLPHTYATARRRARASLPEHATKDYWTFLYQRYHAYLGVTLAPLPTTIQVAVEQLLTTSFGPCPDGISKL